MKRFYAIWIILACLGTLKAQEQKKEYPAFYINTDLHIGNHGGVGLGINWLFDDQHGLQIGYSGMSRRARELPSNFHGGLGWLFTLGLTTPRDKMRTVYASYANAVYLGPRKKSRAVFTAGLGHSDMDKKVDFTRSNLDPLLDPNYTWRNEKLNAVSLILGCRIEFLVTEPFGFFAVSPTMIINREASYVGLNFGMMLGKLR